MEIAPRISIMRTTITTYLSNYLTIIGIMPKINQPKPKRKPVRIPAPLFDEIDKILKKFPMYGNRQRFIETAIQEKIEEVMRFK